MLLRRKARPAAAAVAVAAAEGVAVAAVGAASALASATWTSLTARRAGSYPRVPFRASADSTAWLISARLAAVCTSNQARTTRSIDRTYSGANRAALRVMYVGARPAP